MGFFSAESGNKMEESAQEAFDVKFVKWAIVNKVSSRQTSAWEIRYNTTSTLFHSSGFWFMLHPDFILYFRTLFFRSSQLSRSPYSILKNTDTLERSTSVFVLQRYVPGRVDVKYIKSICQFGFAILEIQIIY